MERECVRVASRQMLRARAAPRGMMCLIWLSCSVFLQRCSVCAKPDSYAEGKPKPNENVHIFFYAWFATPDHDGEATGWREWGKEVLSHWDEKEKAKHESGKLLSPPEDVASVFYPDRGLYSSQVGVAASQCTVRRARFLTLAHAAIRTAQWPGRRCKRSQAQGSELSVAVPFSTPLCQAQEPRLQHIFQQERTCLHLTSGCSALQVALRCPVLTHVAVFSWWRNLTAEDPPRKKGSP